MQGRWKLRSEGAFGMDVTGPETVGWVPVVPCDDTAIERAARALCDDEQEAWDELDALDQTLYRGKALKVLRAAGETP